MIKYLLAAFLLLNSFPSPSQAQDSAAATSPIVLELFTSQSCSSCPPADKILGALEKQNDNVIALSCHVTYWNHLHWKDTLSQDFCTQRQRGYVQALNARSNYTPQIVVNGKTEIVGSREGKIRRVIEQQKHDVQAISIKRVEYDLDINLPQLPKAQYVVSLLTHGDKHTQSIPSGENRGRTIQYTNPVESIIPINTWDGTAKSISYDVTNNANTKGFVVLVQKQSPTGEIVAAGKLAR